MISLASQGVEAAEARRGLDPLRARPSRSSKSTMARSSTLRRVFTLAIWSLGVLVGPTEAAKGASVGYRSVIVGHYDFRCPELPGVVFRFPISAQWEPRGIEVKKGQGCIVHLSWPSTIKFEMARMVIVTNIPDYTPEEFARALGGKEFFLGRVRCFVATRNPNGILYGYAFDPTLYVEGYQPPVAHWDYLQFYGEARIEVRVWIHGGAEDQGFSNVLFANQVVESFGFTE